MAMDSYMNGVTPEYDAAVQPAQKTVNTQKTAEVKTDTSAKEIADLQQLFGEALRKNASKEPTISTIDSAISEMNAKMSKTHCAYAYDADTKRITIKVYDDETDELIREVPPEKSLEVLKKVWESAGIIIDEKR